MLCFPCTTSCRFFPAPLGAGRRPASCYTYEAARRDDSTTWAGEAGTPLPPRQWRRLLGHRWQHQLAPRQGARAGRWLDPKDGCGLQRPPTAAAGARATTTTITYINNITATLTVVFSETSVRGTARGGRRRGGRLRLGAGVSRGRPSSPPGGATTVSCGDGRLRCCRGGGKRWADGAAGRIGRRG